MTERVRDRRLRRMIPLGLAAAALLVLACEVARPDADGPVSPVAPRGFAVGDTIRFPGGAWQIARAHGCAEDSTRSVDRRDSVALAKALNGSIKCEVEEDLAQEMKRLRAVDAHGATGVGPAMYQVTAVDGEKAFMVRRRALAEGAERFRVGGPVGSGDVGVATARVRPQEVKATPGMDETPPHVEVDGKPAPPSVLQTLDATRIQSISVLKGPRAAAYLGKDDGRALIQITTKK